MRRAENAALGGMDLLVYVARVAADCTQGRGGVQYVGGYAREDGKRPSGGKTRFLSFFANVGGRLPFVRFDREGCFETFGGAREWLFIQADGNKESKCGIAFLADGSVASEKNSWH